MHKLNARKALSYYKSTKHDWYILFKKCIDTNCFSIINWIESFSRQDKGRQGRKDDPVILRLAKGFDRQTDEFYKASSRTYQTYWFDVHISSFDAVKDLTDRRIFFYRWVKELAIVSSINFFLLVLKNYVYLLFCRLKTFTPLPFI